MSETSERLKLGEEFHTAIVLEADEEPDLLHKEFAAVGFRRAAETHRVRFGELRSAIENHGGKRAYVTTAEVVEVLP